MYVLLLGEKKTKIELALEGSEFSGDMYFVICPQKTGHIAAKAVG